MRGVLGLIKKDGKFLLGTEAKDRPYRGKWRLLGGNLEEGEDAEQALVRELMEEAGIVVKAGKKLGECQGTFNEVTISVMLGEHVSGVLKPKADEVGELRYFTMQELDGLEIEGLSKTIIIQYRDRI